MIREVIAFGFGVGIAACSAPPRAVVSPQPPRHTTSTPRLTCASNDARPNRGAFLREVLFAETTDATPRFDDYTPDSYHIDKLDLARGLPGAAAQCDIKLNAALIVGPAGPLWSYYVAALVEDGGSIRVNSLVMPHARITGKGTGMLTGLEASGLLEGIEKAPLVQAGLPSIPTASDDSGNADFSYRLLLVIYDPAGPRYFHANFNEYDQSDATSGLLDKVNALLSKTSATYRVGDRSRKPTPAP